MKKPKYYYSTPVTIKKSEVLSLNSGVIVGVSKKETYKCRMPRITICGIYDDETDTLSFGLAKCSPKDQFVKSIGREIAYERALNDPICIVKVGDRRISEVYSDVALDLDIEYSHYTDEFMLLS